MGIEMEYGANRNENQSEEIQSSKKLYGCSFYEKEDSVTLEDGFLTAKQQPCKADSISPSAQTGHYNAENYENYENYEYYKDFEKLAQVLPPKVLGEMKKLKLDDIIEVVLDIGRCGELRHLDKSIEYLGEDIITQEDIDYVISRIDDFTSDNRSGIPGTLHRISAIRNRKGKVIGLTCRVGRVVTGTINCIKDLVLQGKSILFLGRPGVGKTTKLREIARLLADDLGKRVIVVDTSNEIAGDGDIPHKAIGSSRRMQVLSPERQKDVMIETAIKQSGYK